MSYSLVSCYPNYPTHFRLYAALTRSVRGLDLICNSEDEFFMRIDGLLHYPVHIHCLVARDSHKNRFLKLSITTCNTYLTAILPFSTIISCLLINRQILKSYFAPAVLFCHLSSLCSHADSTFLILQHLQHTFS